ncbi:MAG: hypothetical protein Q4B90_06885 [Eubacteriales bacterium]|nr:hypothetical protein [Eubacteriales bacterium]
MKTKIKKRICQTAMLMVTGCMMTGNAMAKDSNEISDGIYSWFLVQAYDDACKINGGKTDIWEHEIEGRSAEEWITETAKSYTKEYLAVEQQFEEQKMELTEEEKETIDFTVERYWNELGYGRYYAEYEITEDDFAHILENSNKMSKLYVQEREALKEEVTQKEMASYIEEHGSLVQYIAVPYTQPLDENAEESEKDAWMDTDAVYEEYKERLESGENMEDLIREVNGEKELQAAGISSSYSDICLETLFLDSNSSLSTGFKKKLKEAPEDEIVCFDDEAQYHQIIFMKKAFREDWAGIELYREELTELIAEEKFNYDVAQWSEEIEIANEDDLVGEEEAKEMFSEK